MKNEIIRGYHVKEFRQSLFLSQKKMANLFGFKEQSTISHWEKQPFKPIPDNSAKYFKLLFVFSKKASAKFASEILSEVTKISRKMCRTLKIKFSNLPKHVREPKDERVKPKGYS